MLRMVKKPEGLGVCTKVSYTFNLRVSVGGL
jgi:hypothetical protein